MKKLNNIMALGAIVLFVNVNGQNTVTITFNLLWQLLPEYGLEPGEDPAQ
jgi:hypothetical protein